MSLLLLTQSEPLQKLRIDGTRFRTEDGELFSWRGFSYFLGFLRFCRGEDITPDLRYLRENGFNILRIFGPLPWLDTPDYRIENFQFDKLDQFLSLVESYGFYTNWSLCHYNHPLNKGYVQAWFDIAANHYCVAEMVNEPHVGKEKPDPIALLEGIDRRGVLTAYGYYGKYYDSSPGLDPVLDFGTLHVSRDDAWHRKARHAQELQHAVGKPIISDEPAKIVEPGFYYPGGKNDPLNTPSEAVWHGAICFLYTPGFTLHTEEGKWGRVPLEGTLQHDVIARVKRDVFDHFPAAVQLGQYKGAHSSGSPVDGKGLKIDGEDIWTYSSVHPSIAWSVRCAKHQPQPLYPWTLSLRWGGDGELVIVEKD